MHRVLLTVLIITFVSLCAAQLNFTPNWGKRTPTEGESNRCKESVDTIMLIYKIIQNEAQKLVDCEKYSN
ncbi:hypertrehalosaemic prohormone [Tribolium madens]|uniref:hypertrehalosaemic prohormone n=1 Tax=Tribolium madens TaxID=41895 RepID=UPI001CF75B0B|nr:hypertrehalosaemic prohormone [Tribolium madens]